MEGKHAGGRPKKQIDKGMFEKLCEFQCTEMEICSWFDIDDKTLTRWCNETYGKSFSEIFKLKRGKGQISLRRTQWQLAEKNPSMAIFLGKQYLNQRDNPDIIVADMSKVDELLKEVKDSANK